MIATENKTKRNELRETLPVDPVSQRQLRRAMLGIGSTLVLESYPELEAFRRQIVAEEYEKNES